jgi:hypothetical protein
VNQACQNMIEPFGYELGVVGKMYGLCYVPQRELCMRVAPSVILGVPAAYFGTFYPHTDGHVSHYMIDQLRIASKIPPLPSLL